MDSVLCTWGRRAIREARSLDESKRASLPERRTLPDAGFAIPSARVSSVDFPQPLGPRTEVTPPSGKASEKPEKSSFAP